VTAIVADRRERIRRYIEERGLPFDILVDERQDVIRAYGVWHRFGFGFWSVARPAAFLIDTDGSIRASWIGAHQREFPATGEILERWPGPPAAGASGI
jgi:peroxiredoxin Q/BCP